MKSLKSVERLIDSRSTDFYNREQKGVSTMFELLKQGVPYQAEKRPAHIEYHRIFDTIAETGGHHFLHGVAIDEWRGRLYACFAFNENAENSITERLMVNARYTAAHHDHIVFAVNGQLLL